MIDRPEPWKRDLGKLAQRMERRRKQMRWTPSSNFPFEKDVFVSAFIVRKLMDSKQVSRRISAKALDVMFYPVRNPDELRDPIRHFTHRFNVMKGQKRELKTREFMNQIIHSYHFSPFVAPGFGVFGFFVASDLARRGGLYYVTLDKFSKLIAEIGGGVLRID